MSERVDYYLFSIEKKIKVNKRKYANSNVLVAWW